jgi:hypothetical protein
MGKVYAFTVNVHIDRTLSGSETIQKSCLAGCVNNTWTLLTRPRVMH